MQTIFAPTKILASVRKFIFAIYPTFAPNTSHQIVGVIISFFYYSFCLRKVAFSYEFAFGDVRCFGSNRLRKGLNLTLAKGYE
jgi:hypothetical protein